MIATCLKIYTKAGKVNSHDDQCSSVIIEVKKMNNVQSVHCSCHCSEENLVFSDPETHSLGPQPPSFQDASSLRAPQPGETHRGSRSSAACTLHYFWRSYPAGVAHRDVSCVYIIIVQVVV